MKTTRRLILISLLLVSIGLPVAAQTENGSAGKEVRAAIEKYRTALMQRDTAALEKIWADDYTFINGAGEVVTKKQRLDNIKSGATTLGSINEDQDVKVRVDGNTAVVTSRVTIKGQYSGKEASGQYRSMHVWVKEDAGWRLVANQLTPVITK